MYDYSLWNPKAEDRDPRKDKLGRASDLVGGAVDCTGCRGVCWFIWSAVPGLRSGVQVGKLLGAAAGVPWAWGTRAGRRPGQVHKGLCPEGRTVRRTPGDKPGGRQ